MKLNKILTLISFGFIFITNAQDPEKEDSLSFEECAAIAIQNNYGIQIARNDNFINENLARPGVSGLLPLLIVDGGANYSLLSTEQEFVGAIPDVNQKNKAIGYNGALRLNYSLFRGLRSFKQYDQSKEVAKLSNLDLRRNIELTLLDMALAYYDVVLLDLQRQLLQLSVEISLDRYNRLQARKIYSSSSTFDLLNSRVDLTQDSASLLRITQQYENALRSLNVFLARPPNKELLIPKEIPLYPSLNFSELEKETMENNIFLLIADQNIVVNDYDLKVSKAAYGPDLILNASYGYDLQTNSVGILLNNERLGTILGARLVLPIYEGNQRRVFIENSRVRLRSAQFNQKNVDLEIERDLYNVFNRYQQDLAILEIEEGNIEAARLNFSRSKDLYQLGKISNVQFRDVQLSLLESYNRIIEAKIGVRLTEIALLQISGNLIQ